MENRRKLILISGYEVEIEVASEEMTIKAQDQNHKLWQEIFNKKQIENLTRKAGSFKSFEIFLKMLFSSIEGRSETLFVQILTANELGKVNGKGTLYLILTYEVEFDRVHYPLILWPVKSNNQNYMKSLIKKLKLELEMLKETMTPEETQAIEILREKEGLNNKIQELEGEIQSYEAVESSISLIKVELEAFSVKSSGEIKSLYEKNLLLEEKRRNLEEIRLEVLEKLRIGGIYGESEKLSFEISKEKENSFLLEEKLEEMKQNIKMCKMKVSEYEKKVLELESEKCAVDCEGVKLKRRTRSIDSQSEKKRPRNMLK